MNLVQLFSFLSSMRQFRRQLSLLALLLCGMAAQAQKSGFVVSGQVFDATTKEVISYATVDAPEVNAGTRTDDEGFFTLRSTKRIKKLRIACVGYKTLYFQTPADSSTLALKIYIEPAVQELKEVVVKPKKYRNKNNPAVELIELVVKNRDRNRIENYASFKEEQYEKIMMGVSNLSEKQRNKRMLKSIKFVMDNTDTTRLKGTGVIPAYLMESVQDYYSRSNPKKNKIVVKGVKKVRFPFLDDDGIERYLRYLYQDVNIYDNYIVLLTDHFMSPIANNAPLFYRYYPADTLEENGIKVVQLQFFPRNKTDMLLQGSLYIALDSTYAVTRMEYGINPNINLNWVRTLEGEQVFQRIPNTRQWALAEETLSLDFGATKRGMGMFGERYVSHQQPQANVTIPDSIFARGYEERTILTDADKKNESYWQDSRHIALSDSEAATYRNIDSLQRTRIFTNITQILYTVTGGFWKPVPGWEVGRINTVYSFNPVEGDRIRWGGRTNPDFKKWINLEGYGAYGFRDKRFKFGIGANMSLSKRAYNLFPYNMLRINYQEDLMTPGVIPIGTFAPTSIATSFTRGANDRFFFQKKLVVQYEKEYRNKFSYMAGVERRDLAPLGSLTYTPVDAEQPALPSVLTVRPYVQLRFAPGEEFYQTQSGWRQRVRFNFIGQVRYYKGLKGVWGGQYDYHELVASAYKFSNVPPIGYNYFYVEAGGIFGKVPYSLLTVHRANQTFGYRFMAYNLMNFMEFVSDRYVAVHMEQSFYGFFTNKIPLVRRLKLREFATLKMIYGQVSDQNQPVSGSGLIQFPRYADGSPLTYTLEAKPYIEASIGLGNIFKILRIDYVRRFTYLDHPLAARHGVRLAAQMQF